MSDMRQRIDSAVARVRARAQRRQGGIAARSRGFTLIEVIVAFALLAVGLGILLAILSGGVHQVSWAGQNTRAALYADSLMSTLGADERLQPGQRHGTFEHGRYRWTLEIERVRDPLPSAAAASNTAAGTPAALAETGDVTERDNELYRIALDMRWGDQPDQRLHLDSLRAYTPGLDLSQ